MENLFTLFWLLGGPAFGFYVARRRGGPVLIGMVTGLLAGPCLTFLLVPLVMGFFGDERGRPLPQGSAGRSFGVDEDPELGGRR